MKTKISALGSFVLFVLPLTLFAGKSIILKQENAPMKIEKYVTSSLEDVIHKVTYKNISQQNIVAFKIGFISFDVFNEFLDSSTGAKVVNIGIAQSKKSVWTHAKYRGFVFEKYGTGIAFVDAVRLEDGTIWKVDYNEISPQIKEIFVDFSADILKKKEEK